MLFAASTTENEFPLTAMAGCARTSRWRSFGTASEPSTALLTTSVRVAATGAYFVASCSPNVTESDWTPTSGFAPAAGDAGSGHVIVGEGRGVGVGVGVGAAAGAGAGAGGDAGAGAGAEVGVVPDVAPAGASSAVFDPPPQAATETLSIPITIRLISLVGVIASGLIATTREDGSSRGRGGWP